jgi:16S rRNA (guanine966-N2)-methyltransferase
MKQQKSRRARKGTSEPGRLRIVAGKWRSRLLPVVDEAGLRPTPERVRETLFNWLAPNIEGRRCLDLFAGSGALGLEALSRGASSVIFVEKSPAAAKMLGDNIARLDAGGASLRYDDALQFVQSAAAGPFDIVFLDPPFAEDLLEDLCRLLAGSGMLAPGARVYLEQERRQARAELPAGWQIEKENSAGNVRYSLAVVDT